MEFRLIFTMQMMIRSILMRRVVALGCIFLVMNSCAGNPNAEYVRRASPAQLVRPNRGVIPAIPPPLVTAQSVIVVSADTGQVLYQKNADQQREVASTQKVVTALCVLDAGNLDKMVQIQRSDTLCEPTKLGLRVGEQYSRRELLKVLMVKSANDVARALARDVAGSVEAFAGVMNRKAMLLGMRHSYFLNPNGLPNSGQYSTARDLAIAARYAYRSPLLRSFFATREYYFRYANGRSGLIKNTNHVLRTLPYCNGMKTGTTNAAGRCLVATGLLNGRSTIVVVLKADSKHVWRESEALLRWSLEN